MNVVRIDLIYSKDDDAWMATTLDPRLKGWTMIQDTYVALKKRMLDSLRFILNDYTVTVEESMSKKDTERIELEKIRPELKKSKTPPRVMEFNSKDSFQKKRPPGKRR